jgi:uncharacterized protein YjbI with pentapeptide repeats
VSPPASRPSWWRRLLGQKAERAPEPEDPELADARLLADPRFAETLAGLTDEHLATRLEALDALAVRLCDPDDGPAALGFLATWIRTPSPLPVDETDVDEDGFELDYPLRRDVHAALRWVATRQPWEDPEGPRTLDLGGAYLARASIDGVDLCGADLREVDLRQASLRGARLVGAHMGLCDLGGADLTEACLDDARFMHGFVTAGKLVRASLQRVQGDKLDLRETDAEGADFRDAVLPRAIVRRTHLVGANLGGVSGLNAPDLSASFLDASTVCPLGIDQDRWAELVAESSTYRRTGPAPGS